MCIHIYYNNDDTNNVNNDVRTNKASLDLSRFFGEEAAASDGATK